MILGIVIVSIAALPPPLAGGGSTMPAAWLLRAASHNHTATIRVAAIYLQADMFSYFVSVVPDT